MKAVFLESINNLTIKDVPIPEITDDEIIIKVDSCGICGSDLRILESGNDRITPPQIIGHETSGTVVRVGENQKHRFNIGDKIALSADIACGKCVWCKEGFSNNCLRNVAFGYEYPGGFAEYLKLDKRILDFGPVVITTGSSASQDEFSMSEPLACCINCYELCNMSIGKKVLILGAGPMGCMLTILGKVMGASVVVLCDIDSTRLEVAKRVEADRYIISAHEELEKAKNELTDNLGFDIIITACPSIDAQEMSLKYIKNKGVINFFGGLPGNTRNISINSNLIHYKELTILGSHGSTSKHHKLAVEMIMNKKINLKPLITKTFPLEEIDKAYEEAKNKNNLKIIINP